MLNAIVVAVRFVILLVNGHKQVALENAALRQQLAVFKRDKKRPTLRGGDRVFWIALSKVWKNWKSALVMVRPETVISWQRNRFKRYWRQLSQAKGPGRPAVSSEICKLIRTMAEANVTWGAPRIHGELLSDDCCTCCMCLSSSHTTGDASSTSTLLTIRPPSGLRSRLSRRFLRTTCRITWSGIAMEFTARISGHELKE